MKKLLLICAVAAICFGFCSAVLASPTLPVTGSSQTDSQSYEVKEDSEFFLVEWLYWFLDDVLGIKDRDKKHYYPVNNSSGNNSGDTSNNSSGYDGDSSWVIDPGDYDWNYDPTDGGSGDNGSDSGSGDNGSGSDSGDSGWGNDSGDGGSSGGSGGNGWDPYYPDSGDNDWGSGGGTNPTQTIPAPGAFLLGGIGSAIVGLLRRRRAL